MDFRHYIGAHIVLNRIITNIMNENYKKSWEAHDGGFLEDTGIFKYVLVQPVHSPPCKSFHPILSYSEKSPLSQLSSSKSIPFFLSIPGAPLTHELFQFWEVQGKKWYFGWDLKDMYKLRPILLKHNEWGGEDCERAGRQGPDYEGSCGSWKDFRFYPKNGEKSWKVCFPNYHNLLWGSPNIPKEFKDTMSVCVPLLK